MKKILGLDLGTNSIGWALIEQNFENKEGKILGMGSRIIPMGTDKQDYEKGVGITKNADRRTKRTIRKMNKRYKLRRNKLLFILHELGMLPEQFQFKNGIPNSNKIQELELLPIKRGTMQLDSLSHYQLKADAIENVIRLKDFGKILYSFNQLRGYAGGSNNDDLKSNDKGESENDEITLKKDETITKKVIILNVEKSDTTYRARSGANKGQELSKYDVWIAYDDIELKGETELQNLSEKIGEEEELKIRIRRNKNEEITSVTIALPQKSNWRKQMEEFEKGLKVSGNYVSQEILKILKNNKWEKIRNRVVLRHRYQEEFDEIWDTQSKEYSFLNNCPKDKLEKIAYYIFPGQSESQQKLRKEAIEGGLRYIIRDQIIYYQRPLKSQEDLISKCQFETEEPVVTNSHPLFQEFRCWDQINRLFVTSKKEVWNEKRKKNTFQYTDRFLTHEQKQDIYNRLQTQKQSGFNEVKKIIKLEDDKGDYLNGLNVKAKLKGCDTLIDIKKRLGEHFETLYSKDEKTVIKLWKAIFDNANNGSEYDPKSLKVSSIIEVLEPLKNIELQTELALKLAQNIKYPRKYGSLSEKAIKNILPLMQLNPVDVPEVIKQKFHLIQTGEILDYHLTEKLEDYVISFIEQNPKAIETGGLMYALASSLAYKKHTKDVAKPTIKNYHNIKYEKRNLRNPIVEQLSNETMQIIKALWKQYEFNPEEVEVRIELARDLKNSAAERDKIYKGQIKSQKINEAIKKRLIELKQEPSQRNLGLYKLWSTQNVEDYPAPKKVSEPTKTEIEKLRIWEEQKCISPYTLKPIPLSKLFSPERLYDIDHIIPKSRYFDDSLSNKVVCETNINEEKGNRTAWEYISQQNSKIGICSEAAYVSHINSIFYGRKKKNLLLEKIPTDFVERQKKDTQYISVAVKNELAKVFDFNNIKTSTGEVTSFLRSRWGLRDLFMKLTQERFKQMELWDINPETGLPNEEWVTREFDERKNKNVLRVKSWSKRYDHRHHAIDALVVALTQQSHIQRLNNLNKYLQDELTNRQDEFKLEVKEGVTVLEAYFNLEEERRREIQEKIESSRYFEIPFKDLVAQAKTHLETMTVSIKPKDKLGVSVDKPDKNTPHKKLKPQLKIRGALHQETYYGSIKGRDTKRVELSTLSIIKNKTTKKDEIVELIDKVLESEIIVHKNLLDEKAKPLYQSMKEAFTGEGLKTFNDKRVAYNKQPVYKIKVWYNKEEKKESSLQRLYDRNEKQGVITGDNYLFLVMEKEGKKGKERVFDIASLYDSAIIAKQTIKENDKNFKQRICEDYRLKHKEKPEKVLFTLQQGDLVYLPENKEDLVLNFNNEELKEWLINIENKKRFNQQVYKVVMFTGKDCKFIPNNYANAISIKKDLSKQQIEDVNRRNKGKKSIPKNELNYVEFGSYRDCSPYPVGETFIKNLTAKNKSEKEDLEKIQDTCIKLEVDWLGNISKV
ncbi:type II CRISPR RNA-guided endonuclease Cas9 [Flavobacterium sp.]|uniref:type II CRISPR RNA-guided endonuclease Cas9 n=1 Tax=Flavobacterium sp. TaxID=239 RepID=UPI003526D779